MACLAGAQPGPGGNGQGTEFVPFQASDDWDFIDPTAAFPLLMDAVSCPGGEVSPDLNPPVLPAVTSKYGIWLAIADSWRQIPG